MVPSLSVRSPAEHPESRTAFSMLTRHQRPHSRVVRPSRESNPVHPLSHGEAVVQTRGVT